MARSGEGRPGEPSSRTDEREARRGTVSPSLRVRSPRSHLTPHGENAYSPDSLLRALTANPLDIDSLRPTEITSAEASPPDTLAMRAFTFVLAVLLGITVAVSVLALRTSAVAEDSPRAELRNRVLTSRAHVDDLLKERESKEQDLSELQQDSLSHADSTAASRISDYETLFGGVSLHGPGIQLTINDSTPLPPAPGASEGAVNRVTDTDLQIAVNGLWAAGAEAVSINGARLTSTSAIRTAGEAVLVDFHPLSPPYTISAIGDPSALAAAVRGDDPGSYLADLATRFGIRYDVVTVQDLTVPARPRSALRDARPIDAPRTPVTGDSDSTAGADGTADKGEK